MLLVDVGTDLDGDVVIGACGTDQIKNHDL